MRGLAPASEGAGLPAEPKRKNANFQRLTEQDRNASNVQCLTERRKTRTSNIEHRTSNVERRTEENQREKENASGLFLSPLMFDVRRSMFNVRCSYAIFGCEVFVSVTCSGMLRTPLQASCIRSADDLLKRQMHCRRMTERRGRQASNGRGEGNYSLGQGFLLQAQSAKVTIRLDAKPEARRLAEKFPESD